MRLATLRTPNGQRAARIEPDGAWLLPYENLDELLARSDWRSEASQPGTGPLPGAGLVYAPPVTRPSKIFCVGHNYRSHILEMGRELPQHPTLFAKFANCLAGASDDLVLPPESVEVDWEAELAIIVGRRCRRIQAGAAQAAIAGFTVANDVSMRDWQWRTPQWLQGKAFEGSTPLGPELVTLDELDNPDDLRVTCAVNGKPMQDARTRDLLFGPNQLVAYVSTFTTLEPGDLILTGTPGGVGAARDPKVFLQPGDLLTTEITGLGCCRNQCTEER
jgi:acylpyruvate hydrolase